MKDIAINQLLEYTADGLTERVLWIDPSNKGFYVIDIAAPAALPLFRGMEDMERMREAEVWRWVEADPWMRPAADEAISAAQRARRDKTWAMLRPLVMGQPAIFHEGPRGRAIAKAMAETGATKQTLYRLLRRYWQRGLTPNALLPDYEHCGGRGRDKAASAKKRGRSHGGEVHGVNVTPEIRSMFRAVITRRFAAKQQFTVNRRRTLPPYRRAILTPVLARGVWPLALVFVEVLPVCAYLKRRGVCWRRFLAAGGHLLTPIHTERSMGNSYAHRLQAGDGREKRR
jgi:hypothetical protein